MDGGYPTNMQTIKKIKPLQGSSLQSRNHLVPKHSKKLLWYLVGYYLAIMLDIYF